MNSQKEEHMDEMLKAATNKRYLEDIAKQALFAVKKSKIQQDKKDCFKEALPAMVRYGSAYDARDEVLAYLEGICRGSYNLSGMHWIHDGSILFQHYEHFDAESGEASKCRKNFQFIEIKYNPSAKSAHSQAEVSHFRESIEGFY